MPGLRIVAGRHRGRRLATPAGQAVRPTSGRAREALFNILAHGRFGAGGEDALESGQVLDAFAGSGALGLEALSRGAARAVFMERDRAALDALRANVRTLGEVARCRVLEADALHPPPAREPCTLAFLDPPYGQGLAAPALQALANAGWFALGAVVTVELAAGEEFEVPPGFVLLDERRYGKARLLLLRASAAPE
jgi:16S rRNA (guanine966-N2)-methyltransferase